MNTKIFGYDWEDIQARQMKTYVPKAIAREAGKDYGSDPIGDGMVRMVPSGDVVTADEAVERLRK